MNNEYQYAEFSISARYTYYLLQIYTATFYSYICPIGPGIVMFIFIVQYWIDKYNLFTRTSLLVELSYKISRETLKLFEASLVVFTAGNFIFSNILTKR